RERSSGVRYSGKIVTMSTRTARLPSQIEEAVRRSDDDPAASHVHLGHHGRDERNEPGTPVREPDHEQVGGRSMINLDDLADRLALGRLGPEPDQLVVVELVRVLEGWHRVAVDAEQH